MRLDLTEMEARVIIACINRTERCVLAEQGSVSKDTHMKAIVELESIRRKCQQVLSDNLEMKEKTVIISKVDAI